MYIAKGKKNESIKPRFTRGSPERLRGLADATARTSRIKKFTLAEAINFLLKYDPIGIFFLCWVIGFGGCICISTGKALSPSESPREVKIGRIFSSGYLLVVSAGKSQLSATEERKRLSSNK